MANMHSVSSAGVSKVATKLEQMGFLAYERGQISILDRPLGFP
jgi:DNA-binding transcriptional regulator YhcF (GntR family)